MLVYLDALLDTDMMLRDWSSDNEKRVYSRDLELEGGGRRPRLDFYLEEGARWQAELNIAMPFAKWVGTSV